MNKKQKILKIIELLNKKYPNTRTALKYKNPLEMLVSTMLSAQCTDKQVNIVTKELFKKYKTPEDYADAGISELENDIHSTGFYKNKAKNIKTSCKIIIEKFNSKEPKIFSKATNIYFGLMYAHSSGANFYVKSSGDLFTSNRWAFGFEIGL